MKNVDELKNLFIQVLENDGLEILLSHIIKHYSDELKDWGYSDEDEIRGVIEESFDDIIYG